MEKSFEDAMEELENIVKTLQNGELTLDQSMDQFKKGISLANVCNEKLKNAEESIKILVENLDNSVTEEDFKE
ncbi:MAG: exodeoxyribonuclease VII small subunit [Clostridia bacterium]|nr:exodeoxyribonuclease VII small subunit [Clostridia bacterium]